jgi:predicted nucleotidyltransferase
MNARDLAIARKFKELVVNKIPVRDVRVFGSRARGIAVNESDLDILITVDNLDREVDRYISDCAWEAGFPEDVVIVPIVVDHHEIEDGHLSESSFIQTVKREGISI